jgi:hypothetical protein
MKTARVSCLSALGIVLASCAFEPVAQEADESEQLGTAQLDLAAVTPGAQTQHRVGLHVVRMLSVAGEAPPLSTTKLNQMVETANATFAPANIQFFIDKMDDYVMPHFTRVRGATLRSFATVKAELEQIAPVAGKYADTNEKDMGDWLTSVGDQHMPGPNANFRTNVFVFAENGPTDAGNTANAASRSSNYMAIRDDVQNAHNPTWNFAHELGHSLGMMHTNTMGGAPLTATLGEPRDACTLWDMAYLKKPGYHWNYDSTFFGSREHCVAYMTNPDYSGFIGHANLGGEACSCEPVDKVCPTECKVTSKCSSACASSGTGCPDACWFTSDAATNQLGLRLQGRVFRGDNYSLRGISRPIHDATGAIKDHAYELMAYSPVAGWGDPRFISDSEIEFFRDRTFKDHHLSQTTCFGKTKAGSTGWVQYAADGVYLDVDTSYCGLGTGREGVATGVPIYFASLGGDASHWLARGVSSIYAPTANGFRVYVKRAGVTPAWANERKWHINWAGHDAGLATVSDARHVLDSVCVGRTSPASTDWKAHSSTAVYADIDTSRCKLTSTPNYLTSLGGDSQHWDTYGVTSIYSPTATGFRVYVIDGAGVTPTAARTRKWHVNWKAVPRNRKDKGSCSGISNAAWQNYDPNSVFIDVDTSACASLVPSGSTPTFFTTLTGRNEHHYSRGATSISSPSKNGFRIYISRDGIDKASAEEKSWKIQWVMQP